MLKPQYLPDVNLLVSLLAPSHEHHGIALKWFLTNHERGWATCPSIQSATIRVLWHYSPKGARYPFAEIAHNFNELTRADTHTFIPDDIEFSSSQVIDFNRVQGPRQLPDIHLVALAVKHDLQLVTLDKRINFRLVRNAKPEHIIVLR